MTHLIAEIEHPNCLRHLPDEDCGTAALHLVGVNFSYKVGQPVLSDITLCVHHGVFLGLIGPNGGGKSTLMKIVLGLLKPNSGTVRILGRDLSTQKSELRSLVGYVPQQSFINPAFPVNATDVVRMNALPATQNARNILQALDDCGVGDLARRPVGAMSGGQLQRVFIARALVNSPRLLLLDEPTNGVDSNGQHNILQLLQKLQRERNISIIMVSHDVGQLTHYADRIACINRKLHWHDSVAHLTDEIVREVFDCELSAYATRLKDEKQTVPATCADKECFCQSHANAQN